MHALPEAGTPPAAGIGFSTAPDVGDPAELPAQHVLTHHQDADGSTTLHLAQPSNQRSSSGGDPGPQPSVVVSGIDADQAAAVALLSQLIQSAMRSSREDDSPQVPRPQTAPPPGTLCSPPPAQLRRRSSLPGLGAEGAGHAAASPGSWSPRRASSAPRVRDASVGAKRAPSAESERRTLRAARQSPAHRAYDRQPSKLSQRGRAWANVEDIADFGQPEHYPSLQQPTYMPTQQGMLEGALGDEGDMYDVSALQEHASGLSSGWQKASADVQQVCCPTAVQAM